jgi:hypothetical protein
MIASNATTSFTIAGSCSISIGLLIGCLIGSLRRARLKFVEKGRGSGFVFKGSAEVYRIMEVFEPRLLVLIASLILNFGLLVLENER